ncbi:hypothetical protein G3N57_06225 [Paraburkholderia sp. Se-20369]|nr:hypothetical protein [Paraburkholderia sp. Se-20369]TCW75955.1 hypothetical protein C5O80_37060 [Burkholderia sp. SRS-46]
MSENNILYQQVVLSVTNAQAGQTIWVELQQQQSPKIGFSTGPNFESSGGIQVRLASGGNLPLTSFNVNAQTVQVITQSGGGGGGGALQFNVTLYLAAQSGISTFALRSRSDPGVQITAQVGFAQPQVVNQTYTLFYWNPQ